MDFLDALRRALASDDQDDWPISWDASGCVVIIRKAPFARDVLPKWFGATRFRWFHETMLSYGFRPSVTSQRHAYEHALFTRARPLDAQRMAPIRAVEAHAIDGEPDEDYAPARLAKRRRAPTPEDPPDEPPAKRPCEGPTPAELGARIDALTQSVACLAAQTMMLYQVLMPGMPFYVVPGVPAARL